jgi:signal transduction histidine kinase
VQPDTLRLHGFTEPGSERALRDLLQLAASFCDAPAVLALQDDTGLWYCKGVGLNPGALAELEASLGRAFVSDQDPVPIEGAGLCLAEGLWLVEPGRPPLGCLCVVAPEPLELSSAQRTGLRHLATQISALVLARRENLERRTVSRAATGASFVPGLVHELRNFSFGISASLDAFQARVVGQETSKYGTVMRASLDRLNAFVEELGEYGNPQGLAWSERPLEPLLMEALAHHDPLARRCQVELRLAVAEPLPAVRADERSLRTAFIQLLDLALQQERPGGCVVLQVGCRLEDRHRVIFGHLDGSGLQLANLELERLFEPFYFRASGLGRLALPVARRIFEAHGGNLTACAGPEGGMRIGFMLPAV